MSKKNVDQWLKTTTDYLPPFMRDFHDAKALFKAIDELVTKREGDLVKRPSWIEAHVYTVDVFLWFMARRGYTLQRSRANVQFRDLQADLDALSKERDQHFANLLNQQTTGEQ